MYVAQLTSIPVPAPPQRQRRGRVQPLHSTTRTPPSPPQHRRISLSFGQVCELTPSSDNISNIAETVAPHRDDHGAAVHKRQSIVPQSPSLRAADGPGACCIGSQGALLIRGADQFRTVSDRLQMLRSKLGSDSVRKNQRRSVSDLPGSVSLIFMHFHLQIILATTTSRF
jgi:hypothetical protein